MKTTQGITRAFCALVAVAISATGADAQTYRDLTDEAALAITQLHNAPTTNRFEGTAVVAAGSELRGNVAIIDGPLVLEGTIVGSVLVVNGSVLLGPAARVTGDVIVVGGDIEGADQARIDGEQIVYREALRYRRIGEMIVPDEPDPIAGLRAGRRFGIARTSFAVALRGAYNRVEGLPIAFGPQIAFGRSNPTIVDGTLIYRTAGGFTLEEDQIGYIGRVEQFVGGHGRWRVGGTLHSEVLPIESNGLSDTEASLATFVLHRDYRDYYEREGWSAYLRWSGSAVADATLEYRDEKHHTRLEQSPWTIFDNGDPFRPQPIVGEGSLRSLTLRFTHDSRNDAREPSSGWLVRMESEQGLGGEMSIPLPDGATTFGVDERFTALSVDARRYLRVGPLTRIALGGRASGSVDGGPLPPQRQAVLGGEGSLPGFSAFEFDCAARDAARNASLGSDRPFNYGCDRAVLGRAMVEHTLPFIRPLGRSLGLDFDFGHEPALVVFADVGRAWTEDGALQGRETGYSDFAADAGLGLRLGRIGFYWAAPLTDGGEANFFVRIGPRF
ncbi:MAG TPA: BamA/TamA family outer membrane protein [Longimicrobiales bacterium]